MDCKIPGFPVFHYLLEFAQTHVHWVDDAIQPSHLLLPLLLLPSVFPSIKVFSNESALHIRWPKYWSFSISHSNEYSGLISFRMDWFDLLAVERGFFIASATWEPLYAPPVSPLGMNPSRASELRDFRAPLPSGLVFFPTSCSSEAQAPQSWLQLPRLGFWDNLGVTKTLTPLFLPGGSVSSVAQLCLFVTTPGFTVHHQLLEPTETHVNRVRNTIQPSHCLLSSSTVFNLFHQGKASVLRIRWPKSCTWQIIESLVFLVGMGGKMRCEVPTSAGPSCCNDLCISPGQSAPHVIVPGSWDWGLPGRGPPLV